jgi:hypothetical protein
VITGLFGVYYKYFSSSNTMSFWDYFTPESIFTFTAPLMVSICIEGTLAITYKINEVEKDSAEFGLLRDSMIISVMILIGQVLLIYNSISKDNIYFCCISVVILFFYWTMIGSTKMNLYRARNTE